MRTLCVHVAGVWYMRLVQTLRHGHARRPGRARGKHLGVRQRHERVGAAREVATHDAVRVEGNRVLRAGLH